MDKKNSTHDDDLVDKDWEPSPEDFLEEKEPLHTNRNHKKWPKMIAGVIAILLLFQVVAIFFQTFSLDAIQFLKTSYRLTQIAEVAEYKKAVVTIQGDRSRGTGFAISEDGLIVTNYHVIAGQEDRLIVGFPNGDNYEGEVIRTEPEIDIALVRVDANNLPYLKISQEGSNMGEAIYVIGNPLSFTQIVNEGAVLTNEQQIIISAPIYRGNSGSPVINMDGEVVAVVYAKRRNSEYDRKTVGLAVPIEYVKDKFTIEQLK